MVDVPVFRHTVSEFVNGGIDGGTHARASGRLVGCGSGGCAAEAVSRCYLVNANSGSGARSAVSARRSDCRAANPSCPEDLGLALVRMGLRGGWEWSRGCPL